MNGKATETNGFAKRPSTNGTAIHENEKKPAIDHGNEAGFVQLIACAGGIYASFLTWALLQERITTTSYGNPESPERFTFSVFLNTVQSTLAAIAGYAYLSFVRRQHPGNASSTAVFPTRRILAPLLLVSMTSSLASPFGYASLSHVDYITFILAKSCKLLPVMFLHLTIFRKRFPLYKYAVVALVTAGVAIFTLQHPSGKKKTAAHNGNSVWGLFLLSINLLFDGLTNSTQDHIFQTFRPYSGPQMMVAMNVISTVLQSLYLLLSPTLARTGLGSLVGMSVIDGDGELRCALAFLRRYPAVAWDVTLFCACGAIGQIFIYYTLAHFSSILLVTITVTRKMLTMLLSVVWFRHRLTPLQWLGVGLVFGGIGAEAVMKKKEAATKQKARLVLVEKKAQ